MEVPTTRAPTQPIKETQSALDEILNLERVLLQVPCELVLGCRMLTAPRDHMLCFLSLSLSSTQSRHGARGCSVKTGGASAASSKPHLQFAESGQHLCRSSFPPRGPWPLSASEKPRSKSVNGNQLEEFPTNLRTTA